MWSQHLRGSIRSDTIGGAIGESSSGAGVGAGASASAHRGAIGNYAGLAIIFVSFFLLVFVIVYVQEAERKIPINYASTYTSRSGGLERSAYLPFKCFCLGELRIDFEGTRVA
ncbi:hypothetical protein G4B88_004550 [Cannabis sativa]|uniref:Uncharacterized protein n=1 Tax=Cannabis sativa TaxID=3483 RepID=A0A7J6DP35_CANSA|nr:hypothetical protein G4B88_004550 [Cannabis sativa]